jgi:DMSO/TMAO reductase YedYZ molybdopterin-dependent catalytic subunit
MEPTNQAPGAEGVSRIAARPDLLSTDLVVDVPLAIEERVTRITPADKLFVLAHLGIPAVELRSWQLELTGLVRRPLLLRYADLLRYPKRTVQTVHQCAGNPLAPRVPTRLVANVVWGGASLREVLADAAVEPAAAYVWTFGLDHGSFDGMHQEHYVKDLPLSRLAVDDVLIAYELDGRPLDSRHGFPARLVVPGYYGTNAVKWLCRLELAARRAASLFTTRFYNDPTPDGSATTPVWELAPESIIVSPVTGSHCASGPVEIRGWAWSAGAVAHVEISTDGGAHWLQAQVEPREQTAWQGFRFVWSSPAVGKYRLGCRAVDERGNAQPLDGGRNAVHFIEIKVGAG